MCVTNFTFLPCVLNTGPLWLFAFLCVMCCSFSSTCVVDLFNSYLQCFKWKKQVPVLPVFACWHVNLVAGNLCSEFLLWIKGRLLEGNAEIHRINSLNEQLWIFCLGVWLHVFACGRAVSSSELIPVWVLFVLFWNHTNITIYLLLFCFSPLIRHWCDS